MFKFFIRRRVRRKKSILAGFGRRNYLKYKEPARELILRRVEYFNSIYNFSYGRISVRNQRSRWGSCSKRGNLNFNYKIVLIPEKLADYIIVHELCHLKEFNHSKNFWALVAKTFPDYKKIKQDLRNPEIFHTPPLNLKGRGVV